MKKNIYLIYFLLFTLGIAATLFGAIFLYKKIMQSLDTQERLALEHQIYTEQISNLPKLAQTEQSVKQNERYFSFIYSEDRVVEIIRDIERLAKEESVTLTITQKEIPKKKPVRKEEDEKDDDTTKKEEAPKELSDTLPFEKHLRLEIKAEGQYSAIRTFLHKLETAPYALDVLSVDAALVLLSEEDRRAANETVGESSPFLIQGESVPEGETTTPLSVVQDVLATFEVALYIQ